VAPALSGQRESIMNPAHWSRVEELFHQVADFLPAERAAFLDNACLGDAELRRDVESLLDQDGLKDDVVGAAVGRAVEQLPEETDLSAPDLPGLPLSGDANTTLPMKTARMEGRSLNGYTLIREIGRGGMGSVYLAERSDGAFRRQVAVKLIRPGQGSALLIARFQQEREILASLDHPNIARLLDAGMTEEGLPYFVMELVEGKPIHLWCDERKLNISQRVELLRDVCSAVRYAHQHLVMHRDLKPGNILVTPAGTVKLLDFGIAKFLQDEKAGVLPATQSLAQMMTPEYASPEQVCGGDVTTLTDVYSLGVLCYEVLTGHSPYHLRRAALYEMARIISEVEPARPSAVIDTTDLPVSGRGEKRPITPQTVSEVREGNSVRLRKRLEGDLDCIVLMALQKNPARRYASVEALDEDLRRHLEHLPVAAKPDDAWYRASRFIGRHSIGAMAVALVLISLLLGTAALMWQARITLDARHGTDVEALSFAPFWVLTSGFVLAACSAATYFLRPDKLRMAGALAGGTVWALSMRLQYGIGFSMGWWRSQVSEAPDPLQLLSLPVLILVAFAGAAAMLVLLAVGRRFGWKVQVAAVVLLAFYQAIRERIWFTAILPLMKAESDVLPLLTAVAIYTAGLSLGLVITRNIGGEKLASRYFHSAASGK
jgi:serine/threonine protein kinase